jgi:hypothetical protein
MNRQLKVALIIGVLVVVAASIGVGVFLAFGSQIGVVVFVIGIPVALVIGGISYVRMTVGEGSTSTFQYTNEQAKQAARDLQDLGRTFLQLRENYPGWQAETVDQRLEEIVASMADVGVEYDRSANSFRVDEVQGSFQEVQTIRGDIESTKTTLRDSFCGFARAEIGRLDEALDRLADAGLAPDAERVDSSEIPEEPDEWDVETARDHLDDQRSVLLSGVSEAVETIHRKLDASDPPDPGQVEASLAKAESELEAGALTDAVSAVVHARRTLDEQLSGSVDETRAEVVALADTILDSTATMHLDRDVTGSVESIRSEAETLDSGMDFQEVERLREDLRSRAIETIDSLQAELRDHATTLSTADLPGGFYTPPDSMETDFVDRLESTADPSGFRGTWKEAAETLTKDVENADRKVSVVDAYDDVAEQITEQLRSTGTVTGDDLLVKQPQQFLGLYYRRNDGLTFDPDVPALRRDDAESHTVVVNASVEGDANVAVDLALEGEYAAKEERLFADGVATFESVPPGEYVLTASAGGDYSPVERSFAIEDDERVAVTLEESSLRDRLCEDVDDVGQYVSEFDDDVQATFDTDGYVDDDVDLPLTPAFVPCLIATWAERNGLTAVETEDGGVFVFDWDQQAVEIGNVIQFNLDPGDSLAFQQVRSDFLSVPLPDRAIREIATSVTDDPAVSVTETAIEREPGGD